MDPDGRAARRPRTPKADPRPEVADVQRARILAAATDAATEIGYAGLTVSEIVARARVSRRTFYELYPTREACFLAACEQALARISEPVLIAYAGHERWRERIAAGLLELLAQLDTHPALARLLLVESLAAGAPSLERRAVTLAAVTRAIDEGRREAHGREPGPLAAEAVVGAVLSVLHARLLAASGDSLQMLHEPLMNAVVLPYFGPAAAARELRRVTPVASVAHAFNVAGEHSDPLRGLDIRLTYRTLRVLSAVEELGSEEAQPSNRAIAAAAGIADQGQTSKLLARLQRLGLIENRQPSRVSGAPFKGEPNRWTLTARGAAVVGTIRDRPGPPANDSSAERPARRRGGSRRVAAAPAAPAATLDIRDIR